MKTLIKTFGIAAVLTGFAVAPALAQDSASTSGNQMSNDSAAATESTGSGMSGERLVASQQKVLRALEEAGYTDAQVMDAAYLVRAQTPDNETVVMMIDTTGRVMGSSAGAGQMGQSGDSGSSMGATGSTDGSDMTSGSDASGSSN